MILMNEDGLNQMVERVSWLSPIDYHILQFYEDHDIEASPKVVAENIDYEQQYTGKRLRFLVDKGVLRQNENQLYELTEQGRKFIAGNLDADELEAADEE